MSEEKSTEMHDMIFSFITVALIAVEMARIEGKIASGEFASSTFLSKWIKTAY